MRLLLVSSFVAATLSLGSAVAADAPRDPILLQAELAYDGGNYVAAYRLLKPYLDQGHLTEDVEANFILGESACLAGQQAWGQKYLKGALEVFRERLNANQIAVFTKAMSNCIPVQQSQPAPVPVAAGLGAGRAVGGGSPGHVHGVLGPVKD